MSQQQQSDPPRPNMDRRARGVGLRRVPAFAAMLAVARWCVWSWRLVSRRDGTVSWTKHPHIPGGHASIRANSLRGAVTYDRAEWAVLEGEADGVGWLLLGDMERVWLDGDKCRDPISGDLASWAWDLIARCGAAYVEVTPSGTGIRIMGKAGLDVPMQARVAMATEPGADPRAALEVFFACARFVTVTGWTADDGGDGQADIGGVALALWDLGEAQRAARRAQRDEGIAARAARAGPGRTRTADIGDIVAALAVAANEDEHWDDWSRVGMAAHAASGGDPEAYEAWVGWSAKCEAKHDEQACRERWDHWRTSPANDLGFGTLAWLAREVEPDWRPPSRGIEGDFDVVEEARPAGSGAEAGKPEAAVGESANGGGDAFARLLERFRYIRSPRGWLDQDGVLLDDQQLTAEAAAMSVSGYMRRGARGLVARLLHPDSGLRRAAGVTMRPGAGELVEEDGRRMANTWRPSTVVPLAGATDDDVAPWLEHARLLIPDEADRARVLDRMAWILQNPGRKINSALVLVGPQGAGKDTLLLPFLLAIGAHNVGHVSGSAVGGAFNGYLRNQILLINEMPPVHKRDSYETIKGWLATPPDNIPINQKGVEVYVIPNVINVWVTSNHMGAIALAEDDRRGDIVLTVAVAHGSSAEGVFYWTRLHKWIAAGGAAAVAGWLLSRDVSRFNPAAAPPVTAAKREMTRLGSHPAVIWVTELWDGPSRPLFDRELVTVGEILAKGQEGRWGAGHAVARNIGMAHVVQGLRMSTDRWLHTDQRVQDGDVRPRLWALPSKWALLSQLSVTGLEHRLAEDRKKSLAHDF